MSNPASAGRCFYNSSGTRCSFFAAVLASARRFTSSLVRMWLTWVFTVGSFTSMICAISALDLSAQSRWRICSSVGVSPYRGQGAGYGKGRQGHFLVGEKPEHRRYDGGQSLCPSLWQRNVQPRKSSSCLLACGILFLAVLYILFSSFFAYFLFPIHYTLIFQGV